jgi:hypothetical protein
MFLTGKRLRVVRGGSLFPDQRTRDTFNSTMEILALPDLVPIHSNFQLNTDFANGVRGGILAEGVFGWICGFRRDNGKKAIFIFNRLNFDQVHTIADLTLEMRTLPSLIANPNHSGEKKVSCILIHGDFLEGGGSLACFTFQPRGWHSFIDLFHENEKGLLELVRSPDWKAPDYYGGN